MSTVPSTNDIIARLRSATIDMSDAEVNRVISFLSGDQRFTLVRLLQHDLKVRRDAESHQHAIHQEQERVNNDG